ncbi:MAG: DUF4421 domain-containing protein [Bacteroidaceae bacterium]|nr:DUF4421 domain-containing protein [Bacteroidaceae bacterium]
MKRSITLCLLFLYLCLTSGAAAQDIVVPADTLETDTLKPAEQIFDALAGAFDRYERLNDLSRRKKLKLIRSYLGSQLKELNNIDTTYITPQLYDFAAMLQTTTTFENFSITSTGEKRQSLDFAPKPTFRLGGYFGWRWLFLGYTFDVGSLLGRESSSKRKTEFDLSFYTSRLGIDVYFRKTGNDFRCKNLNQIFSPENPRPADLSDDFEGLNIQTRGFNLYYIFNYRHFSWPAAFAQNTVQRRSCGTFKLGFSFTHHKVTLDPSKLDARIEPLIDPSMYFDEIKYNDYGINFGYAYNWVPRRNWLLCASFTPQLAYNVVYVDREEARHNIAEAELNRFLNFRDNRFSIDFILRLGLVYNDTKWYAGASFILHSFNHHNEQVRFNNAFGSLNFYVGFNFKKKKEFR